MKDKKTKFVNKQMIGRALKDSFLKLNPKIQVQNPVMFVVYVAAILTTVLYVIALAGIRDNTPEFILGIAVLLWLTVLFANFAEAIAEGRGKAQADALRATKRDITAYKIPSLEERDRVEEVPSASLGKAILYS